MKDNINPSHYKQGKVECIDAIESATIGKTGIMAVCTANIIKYVWRCEEKNGLEDMKKGLWYLIHMIEKEEEKQSSDLVSSNHVAVISMQDTTSFSKL
jgi:hypothetical protein